MFFSCTTQKNIRGKYIEVHSEWYKIYDFKENKSVHIYSNFGHLLLNDTLNKYTYIIKENNIIFFNKKDTIKKKVDFIGHSSIQINDNIIVKYDLLYKIGFRKKYYNGTKF